MWGIIEPGISRSPLRAARGSCGTCRRPSASLLALAGAILMTLTPARAQDVPTFTVLHSFGQGQNDGVAPDGGLTLAGPNDFYGVTTSGGRFGDGTVYKVEISGQETVLYEFGGMDGDAPVGNLVRDSAGNLYGTTALGGDHYLGNVFKLDSQGTLTVLYSFTGSPDGASPWAGLVRDQAGNLYGTTVGGGGGSCTSLQAAPGCGTVFKLDVTGHETILHTFTGAPDGAQPFAPLMAGSDGNLYGVTSYGGDGKCPPQQYLPAGCGTVFKLTRSGEYTVLYSFAGRPDGNDPSAGLVQDSAGNLYGTTYAGGTGYCNNEINCGTVFKVDPSGKETVLYSFAGINTPDGIGPQGNLIIGPHGILYGTTYVGGAFKYGTIFCLTPAGKETVLYTFNGISGGWPRDGLLRDKHGNLYGTAYLGGTMGFDKGVVFRLSP